VGEDGCEDPTSKLYACVKVKGFKNIGGLFSGRLVRLGLKTRSLSLVCGEFRLSRFS
jgi:hypothetical protein